MRSRTPFCQNIFVFRTSPLYLWTQQDRSRTPRLDEVLRYSLLLDSDCEGVFAGEQGKLLKKSLWVEQRGVEPLDTSRVK